MPDMHYAKDSNYSVRQARPEEYPGLGELIAEAYAGVPGFPGPDRQPGYFKLLRDVGTRPPLAHPLKLQHMLGSLTACRGRYHFFAKSSFNAALSSMASARSRLSLAFSASSSRSRLASFTSMFPNFAFQR